MRALALFTLGLVLASCGTDDTAADVPVDDRPLGELARSPGEGIAGAASVVVVSITGTLEDGTVFQEADRVLIPLAGATAGFARGVAGMEEGETKRFTVLPEEGYGDESPMGIPVGATLLYEVTLHDVR